MSFIWRKRPDDIPEDSKRYVKEEFSVIVSMDVIEGSQDDVSSDQFRLQVMLTSRTVTWII